MPGTSPLRETLRHARPLATFHQAFNRRSYIAGMRIRALRRRVSDRHIIERYVETHSVRKLQLGTGPNPLPGWLNTDLLPDTYREHRREIVLLDATKVYPLEDMTFDYIFTEHQIEHISDTDATTMLRECFRVLRPRGRIRIATPDLAAILALYDAALDELQQHYIDWIMTRFRPNIRSGNQRCYVINHMFKDHKHQFIYDYETLRAILEDLGFRDVVRYKPAESDDPVLRGVESHGHAIGDETVNLFETMVVEAVRPRAAGSPRRSGA
jgi:predicted SAM-dependent methyltransferase